MTEVITLHKAAPGSKGAYCHTPTSQDVRALMQACRTNGLLGVVVGEPGTGKTTTAAAFVAEHGNAAGYCRMTKVCAGLQPGLVKIAETVGAYVASNAGAAEVAAAINAVLKPTRGRYLLVLDEAQHMSDELLEAVRDFYDEHGIAVVLVGNFGLTDRWSDKSNKRKYSNFAQLRGRIGAALTLKAPLTEDVEALCGHHGIEGRTARELVARAAGAPGGLHNVRNLLAVAGRLAGSAPIGLNHLKDAASVTGGL